MPAYTHLTTQSAQAYSAANGSNTFQTLSFANSNGVSFSTGTQGVYASISPSAGGVAMKGSGTYTQNTGTVEFANSNGITFGLSANGIMTASYNSTQFQPVGAYLTTAMASNRGSDFMGTNTALTANGVSMTANSSGLSLNFPAFLTTADLSQNSSLYARTGFTTTSVAGAVVAGTMDTNGLKLAVPAYLTTAQAPGAYLTTAALSQDSSKYAGINGAITGGSITVNTSGVSINLPDYLTTAQPVGAYLTTARASNDAIGLNTALTANGVSVTANSSGLSLNFPAFLTTAMQSASSSNFAKTGFTTTSVAGAVVAGTMDTNGLKLAVPAYLTTAQPVGAYLTTARASNDGIGLNTAQSNVTWTVNSSGLSLDARGYVGTATGFTGTNVSATMTHNSAGFSLQLSAGAGGAGVAISASNSAFTSGTVSFNNSGALTIGTGAQAINFSVPATSSIVGVGAITISTNGSTISISGASVAASPVGISAGTVSSTYGTVTFSNANGITFGLGTGASAGNVTASYNSTQFQLTGNYLTTARASNDAIGLNTAGTNVTWTVNSSGISLNAGAYLTTAMASNAGSNFVAATAAFNGTNASGTIASNGISISVGAAGEAGTLANWEPNMAGNNTTFSSMGQNSLYLQKLVPNANYSFNNIELRMSGSFVSSNNSQVAAHTILYGLYSLNGVSYSSIATSSMFINASYSSNASMGYTVSQGGASFTTTSAGTAIASLMTGVKHLYLPFTNTITAGGYYAFGIAISSATTVGTSPFRMALLNQTIINNLTIGKIHASTILASNSTYVGDFAMGVYSTTTGAMPSSLNVNALTNQVSQARLYLQLD
jgi:hypothetical protein